MNQKNKPNNITGSCHFSSLMDVTDIPVWKSKSWLDGSCLKWTLLSVWLFRQRLFENLRMLPHAPGVQMQAIPEDAVPEDTVDEDTEDPDKRLSSKTADHFHTSM